MVEGNPAASTTQTLATPAKPSSLGGYMRRARDEGEYAIGRMTVAGIKKTRTSLRRARSVAEVFETFDPDPTWKLMRHDARELFRALGPLRDLHVMRGWIRTLMPENDEVATAYLRLLNYNERKARVLVKNQLSAFDWKQWDAWQQHLGRRAAATERGAPVILHAAYERWERVDILHRQCMSGAPARVWHDLRKAVKRFRYTLEIFAPKRYRKIQSSVKKLQNTLGELNDLDVLGDELMAIMPLFSAASRRQWTRRLRAERTARIDRYRELVEEQDDPPYGWLSVLPKDEDLLHAALTRWTRRLELSPPGKRGVAALVLHPLIEELSDEERHKDHALLLAAAALMKTPGTAKNAARRIRSLRATPPFTKADVESVAWIVRYARCGKFNRMERRLQHLTLPQRARIRRLAELLSALEALGSVAPDRLDSIAAQGVLLDEDRAVLLAQLPNLRRHDHQP